MARLLTINGETKTISQWSSDDRCEIAESTLRDRVMSETADESVLKKTKRVRANRKDHVINTISIFGEDKTLMEWVEDPRCNVNRCTLRKRYINGVTGPDLLKEPAEANKRKRKKKPNETAFFHGQCRALTTISKMTGVPVETIRHRHRRGLRNMDLVRDRAGKIRQPIDIEMLRGWSSLPRWSGRSAKIGYDCSSTMGDLAIWAQ